MEPNEKFVNMYAAMIQISMIMPFSYPIETLKTRMQINYYKNYTEFFKSLANYSHNKNLYKGISYFYIGFMARHPIKMVVFENYSDPFYGSICAAVSGLVLGLSTSSQKPTKYL
jgi:hypothetical protein